MLAFPCFFFFFFVITFRRGRETSIRVSLPQNRLVTARTYSFLPQPIACPTSDLGAYTYTYIYWNLHFHLYCVFMSSSPNDRSPYDGRPGRTCMDARRRHDVRRGAGGRRRAVGRREQRGRHDGSGQTAEPMADDLQTRRECFTQPATCANSTG